MYGQVSGDAHLPGQQYVPFEDTTARQSGLSADDVVFAHHAGMADLFQTHAETMETTFMEPREFVAQGDRVMVTGFASGRIKSTNRAWEDHWVFAITVRNGKLTNIREYVDTQALARAADAAEEEAR